MKVWKWYTKFKIWDKDFNDTELYAITNKKKYAKEFNKTRNLKLFKCVKTDMDKDEYANYVNNEVYSQQLKEGELVGDMEGEDGIVHSYELNFIMTEAEQQIIDGIYEGNSRLFETSFWYFSFPSYVYNDDIKDALKLLEYDKLRALFSDHNCLMTDMGEINLMPNSLAAFISIYGETLNI